MTESPFLTRRRLLENTAVAAAVAAGLNTIATPAAGAEPAPLKAGQTILFQGDSITDAGRDRRAEDQPNHPRGMGAGYPMLIGCELLRDHSELGLQVLNRGISGNKVPDLAGRWEKDCLELKPAVLSILIGVNDIWHKLNGRFDGTVASYREGFSALLAQTRKALPDTRLIICEPFVLRCGAINEKWFPEFDERRAAAREVAQESGSTWVAFQSMFDEAVEAGVKPAYWAGDGVHPSMAGHSLMAQAWRKAAGI